MAFPTTGAPPGRGMTATNAGTTASGATSNPSSGMSGGAMAGIGAGAYLLGAGLNYMGERQGARSMQDEAERQAAEQAAFARQRHQNLIAALGRYDPNAQPAVAGAQTNARMNAATPALAAGGKALGVSTQPVGAGLLAGQRLAGQSAAAGIEGGRQQQSMRRLDTENANVDASSQMAQQTYGAQSAAAGQSGAASRLAGSTIQSVGMPLMVMGMNQKAEAPVAAPLTPRTLDPASEAQIASEAARIKAAYAPRPLPLVPQQQIW